MALSQRRTLPQNLSRKGCRLAAALNLASLCSPALATTRAYIGGDNSTFGAPGSWNPSGTPGSGDVLSIGPGLSGDLHITLNGLYTGVTSVTFDSAAFPGAYILTETGGTLDVATETFNGANAGNVYNLTQGSANTVANFNLGSASTAHAAYNVLGTGSTLTVTSNLLIGVDGTGVLTQSDGFVNVHNAGSSAFLILGGNSGGVGTYNLNGGNLTVDFFRVGGTGTAVFNQTAGSLTVNGNAIISNGSNFAPATFNYSGGTDTFSGGFSVGIKGTFNLLTGGALPFNVTVNSNGTFNFGGGSFGTGNATINSGGTFNLASGSFNAGSVTVNSGATFNFTGGTFGAGTIALNGGTIQLPIPPPTPPLTSPAPAPSKMVPPPPLPPSPSAPPRPTPSAATSSTAPPPP